VVRVAALLFAAASPEVQALAIFGNASGSTQRAFLTPMGATEATEDVAVSSISEENEGRCSCDNCVSGWRKQPTAVSDTKCVQKMAMPLGVVCNPSGKFPAKTTDTDVPYGLFCMCACQPFLKPSAEALGSVSQEPPACVDLDAAEKLAVDYPDGQRAENCNDPKLPTQNQQNKMAAEGMSSDDVMNLAKEAATPPPDPAAGKLYNHTKAVLKAGNETIRQFDAASTAFHSQQMLLKNPLVSTRGAGPPVVSAARPPVPVLSANGQPVR
jgi:hypothetical protein